jgi:hypothetical protein
MMKAAVLNKGSPVKRILWLALFVLILLASSPVFAADYYVATTGNDSNSGTQAAPWRTIKHAVDKMVAGCTTYVKRGIYNEGLIRFSRSGTASAPIRLLNAPGEFPIVDFGVTESNRVVHRFDMYAGTTTPIGWITIEGDLSPR